MEFANILAQLWKNKCVKIPILKDWKDLISEIQVNKPLNYQDSDIMSLWYTFMYTHDSFNIFLTYTGSRPLNWSFSLHWV